MFRKASIIHFYSKSRYKMVASRQVEIPYYRGVGRQRGRGFGALAQVIGRTAIPFLRKYIVLAAKRVGADFWKLLCQKLQMLLVVERVSRQLESVGRQTLRKQLGEGEGSRRAVVSANVRQGRRRKGAVGGREL